METPILLPPGDPQIKYPDDKFIPASTTGTNSNVFIILGLIGLIYFLTK